MVERLLDRVKWDVYCDESGVERFYAAPPRAGYTLLGSLWLPAAQRQPVKDAIHQLRARHNVRGEFKWNKVSPSREAFYLDLIDLFFATQALRFRCIVIEDGQLEPERFHDGDCELMFYKFYYQLLHHWMTPLGSYRVFIDSRTEHDRRRRGKLREVLSRANPGSDVVQVQALRSHEVDLLQLSDLLIGATSYCFHGHVPHAVFEAGENDTAKTHVVRRLQDRNGGLLEATYSSEQKFNVFVWRGR